jgi:2-oxo-3-hexenedioate decarboxylase
MSPNSLLEYLDSGQLWPAPLSADANFDIAAAYQTALDVRKLRIDRGEIPAGYKVGFTNRNIWSRYRVFAPIWATVWNTTLSFCNGEDIVSLFRSCQPRIEPEIVFGMKATPHANASLNELFAAVEWIAPGFEVVQSHLPDWKFKAADTVADGGLHAHLLVGPKIAVSELATDASALNSLLAKTQVTLMTNGVVVDQGLGSNVLDSPLLALHHFLTELRRCPGAPDVKPGDVITTGTLTDAWPIRPGENWTATFGAPLSILSVEFR